MADRIERFSFALFEIYRLWHDIAAKELKPWGLKVPHALMLFAMGHYEDGITAAQLTELCVRDKSDVSRGIAFLEEKGLILREEARPNLYRAKLRLTDEGKAALAYLRERADLAVALGGRGISDIDRAVFYETMELIAYNLQTVSQDGLPPAKLPNTAPSGHPEDR